MRKSHIKKFKNFIIATSIILLIIGLIIYLLKVARVIYTYYSTLALGFFIVAIINVIIGLTLYFLCNNETISPFSLISSKTSKIYYTIGTILIGIGLVFRAFADNIIDNPHYKTEFFFIMLFVIGVVSFLEGIAILYLDALFEDEVSQEKSQEELEQARIESEKKSLEYKNVLNNFINQTKAKRVKCNNNSPIYISSTSLYKIRSQLDSSNEIIISEVKFENIVMFEKTGDVQYVSEISGGGGGGSSISGAIVGGVIAGGAGAIIGSRKANEKIETNIKEIDSRKTIIIETNGRKTEYDGHEVFFALSSYIPEKSSQAKQTMPVIQQPQPVQVTPAPTAQNITDKMNQLKSLLDSGLITEDDYNKKKEELLNTL